MSLILKNLTLKNLILKNPTLKNLLPKTLLMSALLALLAACGAKEPPRSEAAAEEAPGAEAAPVVEETALAEEAPVAGQAPDADAADENVQISAGVAKAGTAADPAAGDVIPYAQLGQHVGHRAELTTTMGSVRRGTILSSNNYQTEIQLDAAERGYKVTVIADQVAQVRLLPDEPTTAASGN